MHHPTFCINIKSWQSYIIIQFHYIYMFKNQFLSYIWVQNVLPKSHFNISNISLVEVNNKTLMRYTCRILSLYCIVYLYSAQYLHVLQDSKYYMTHPTVQVQSNSYITDIPLTERQRLKDDHLSTSLRFFKLPLGIGSNDRGLPF